MISNVRHQFNFIRFSLNLLYHISMIGIQKARERPAPHQIYNFLNGQFLAYETMENYDETEYLCKYFTILPAVNVVEVHHL